MRQKITYKYNSTGIENIKKNPLKFLDLQFISSHKNKQIVKVKSRNL